MISIFYLETKIDRKLLQVNSVRVSKVYPERKKWKQ